MKNGKGGARFEKGKKGTLCEERDRGTGMRKKKEGHQV